tara:strand:- start:66 stop:419 length:354 start_codon:yes stop_codon:yes gene_type:complete
MRNIDLREAYEAVYESSEEMDTVIQFLLDEGFVETKEDGSLMVESMSQSLYNSICEEVIDEGLEKFKKAQAERRANHMNPDEEEVDVKPEPEKPKFDAAIKSLKKLKQRGMRKGEGL